MIKLLIADDHAVMRDGLFRLFATVDDIEVIGVASDGEEAVALAPGADVVLLDVAMPGLGGIEAARAITKASPEARVVMLTAMSDRDTVLEAIDAGAIGYLLKDDEPDRLFDGVRAAARGEAPVAAKAAGALIGARAEIRAPELTDREREVLDLVAQGLPNKRIALQLEISEKTVKTHLTSIFHRLGVTDRTQAALWAQRNGLGQKRSAGGR
ncbi:MAG: hypothetical protein QOG62_2092 [Thermoleophilaceae bacterium]|jgi:DNA-binding NarL/FixJ family response regulator|nr:hypothetical protein [Thermoleophilaceae bacterium]